MAEPAKERQIPLTLMGVGLTLYVISAFVHAGSNAVAPVLIVVIIGGVINTILLIIAAFIVAAVLNIGFGDLRSAILKFAAATLVAGGIGAIIPFGIIVAAFTFLGLVLWLFELEIVYAIALAVVYFLLSFLVGIALRAAFE